MKKLLSKIIMVTLGLMLLNSCATHSGYMLNSPSLTSNNFKYIKRDVEGTAKVFYVFGIGGLRKMALVTEAKKDLLKNYQLQDNQVLVDLTVNWKKTMFMPFFMSNRCTVTASIAQYN